MRRSVILLIAPNKINVNSKELESRRLFFNISLNIVIISDMMMAIMIRLSQGPFNGKEKEIL